MAFSLFLLAPLIIIGIANRRGMAQMFVPIVSAATVMCSAFAYADSHIYLSCTHGRVEEKITKQDGSVQIETRDEPFSLAVDIDFSHATVNGWRIMNSNSDTPIENQMMIIAKKFLPGDKYTSDTYMDLRINHLTGIARLSISNPRPDACAGEWKGDEEVCRDVASTTIYQCVPADLGVIPRKEKGKPNGAWTWELPPAKPTQPRD